MSAASASHLSRIAASGCVVCAKLGYDLAPAEIHHLKEECGGGQRQSDFLTIPLCYLHHRGGGRGGSYHAGFKEFERLYGTELDLLAATIERVYGGKS
jgi:hypothetical protein